MAWNNYTTTGGYIADLSPYQSTQLGTGNIYDYASGTAMTNATGSYTPSTGDYTMASGYSTTAKPTSVVGSSNIYNKMADSTSPTGSGSGFSFNGSLQELGAGLGAAQTIAGLWSTWEQNKLAKDSFAFNKQMATKNYNMAKDAYDRRNRRSSNIADQLAGKSYDEVYAAQQEYAAARDARNAQLEEEGKM